MYDTLILRLFRYSTDDWATATAAVEDAKTTADVDTGEETTHGHHRNLRITMSGSSMYICGSLAKWYYPFEPITLNRHDAKDAITALSDTFHLDMGRANVQRVDGSKDFIMQHPTQRYYELLAAMPRHSRVQATGNTLYFTHAAQKSLNAACFYDKRREVERRKGDVPTVYQGTNLLRYEYRLTGRIRQQMKWGADVTASDLYDKNFYNAFVKMWADAYFSIEKRRTVDIANIPDSLNTADVVKILCAYGLQHLTPDVEQSILLALKDRVKDAHYISRARAKLRSIRATAKIATTNDLVSELDAQIRNVVMYGR